QKNPKLSEKKECHLLIEEQFEKKAKNANEDSLELFQTIYLEFETVKHCSDEEIE
ncbi:13487_t:CDS:2, partial [Racocetra persica]